MSERQHEMPKPIYIPNVIDIEVTGKCEFNCQGCWGSKPETYEKELTARQWARVFEKLDETFWDHTNRVVITGGEPLLRKDLTEIIDGLTKTDNKRFISLSTTGLDRFNQLAKIIDKIDSIGLPIDGPSAEINSIWRKHPTITDGGLKNSIDTLKFIQQSKPNLQTSIRTLIHPENINQITQIPEFLEESGIDTSRLRWLLYELNNRVKTPGGYDKLVSSDSTSSYKYGPEKFSQEIQLAGKRFDEVAIRRLGNIAGRNFIINPNGECRAVINSESGKELIEKEFGNIHKDFNETIENLNMDIETLGIFSVTAFNSPEYFFHTED